MKDGLISDNIQSICQDSLGYIWIGTGEGLSVFNSRVIVDKPDKKMFMIMPAMKSYMEFLMGKMDNSEKSDASNEKIKKTGEMKKINGYNCEKWILQ